MATNVIDFEVVPGDARLVEGEEREVVLLPKPSKDPEDPLNWSRPRKWLATACVIVVTIGIGIPSAAIYSVLPNIAEERNLSLADLNQGTGYLFLFYGLGCLVFQPLALQYGKRPVYLFSMLATSLICVWPPYTRSNGEWIASKILQGLFGSCVESLPEISMSDLFFEHERSLGLSLYALTLMGVSYSAPLVAGFISAGQGWQWVMWWCSILAAVCFVILFFAMEETSYTRRVQDEASLDPEIDGEEVHESNVENGEVENDKAEKAKDDLVKIRSDYSAHSLSEGSISWPQTSYMQKISLTRGFKSKFMLHYYMFMPFRMAQFPVILWAGFLYGSSLVWFNVLNATEAMVLAGKPYNFSSSMCGLAYVSPLVCTFIVFPIAGFCSDKLKVYFARKRNGFSIPEDRLWLLFVYAILGCAASLLWGIGAYYQIHWFPLVLALGILGGCGVFGPVSSAAYVVDTYRELDAEAMVVVILIRNLMSFACSYGITHWVENLGYKRCFIGVAFCCLATNSSFLVMIFTGPWWRKKQRHAYWSLVQRCRSLGMH
ncbi:ZYRO0E02288p [Zygosaccharomyces rouxii]|uniref:ZYRO0E02288p n=1 Tax=Zygosaccharomyces rouxii (strain ATCC 2623 / CBS 732 / NBRC 1130 / NCYC 568 / NRRL Y-229) TaxID=559307 RepID=C5E428_ZYGRC|nr:uncharacterized protein ZYRO0E02288g [Zygosaccharomyces rouxii]KAH9198351.1 major facilitator superfamily domain-containing protein [Zygosaccharomyces rouxii]CAR30789.1 ZYRO0E02288p [Zygosaccharomyces rouxii]